MSIAGKKRRERGEGGIFSLLKTSKDMLHMLLIVVLPSLSVQLFLQE